MSVNLLYIYIYIYILEHILITPFIFIIINSFVLFLSRWQVHGNIEHVKVSIKAKSNSSKKKLLTHALNPYEDIDDLPFCNNFKLSIFHSVLEIIYLFSYRKCQNIYYRTLSFMNLAPRNISAD